MPCSLHPCLPRTDPKQLAAFWDGLSEAEQRAVMRLGDEPTGERTLRMASAGCTWFGLGCCVQAACAQQRCRAQDCWAGT